MIKGDLVKAQVVGSTVVHYGKVIYPGPKVSYVKIWSPRLGRYAHSHTAYSNHYLTKIGEV